MAQGPDDEAVMLLDKCRGFTCEDENTPAAISPPCMKTSPKTIPDSCMKLKTLVLLSPPLYEVYDISENHHRFVYEAENTRADLKP